MTVGPARSAGWTTSRRSTHVDLLHAPPTERRHQEAARDRERRPVRRGQPACEQPRGPQPVSAGPAAVAGAAATRIGDRTAWRQAGPDVIVAGRLQAPHPSGSGVVTLRLDGASSRTVASAYPGANGVFSFVVPLPGAVPGPKQFTLSFRPYDPARYASSTRDIRVDLLTPTEYPFARPSDDRRPTAADHLPSLWGDGGTCSTGCRPVGAIDGWPLKPFHEPARAPRGLRRAPAERLPRRNRHPGEGLEPGLRHSARPRPYPQTRAGPTRASRSATTSTGTCSPRCARVSASSRYVTVLGHVLRSMGHLHLSEVDALGSLPQPAAAGRPRGRAVRRRRAARDRPRRTIAARRPRSPSRPSTRSRSASARATSRPSSPPPRSPTASGTPTAPRTGRCSWALRGDTPPRSRRSVSRVFTSRAHEPGYLLLRNTKRSASPIWDYRLAGGLAPTHRRSRIAPWRAPHDLRVGLGRKPDGARRGEL